MFLHLPLPGMELGRQHQLPLHCPSPASKSTGIVCRADRPWGCIPREMLVNRTLPHKLLGKCGLGQARIAGDTPNRFSSVQELQTCFCNILNSALHTAVTRICATQPAFPNTSRCCKSSDFSVGLKGVKRCFIALGVASSSLTEVKTHPSKKIPQK